MEVPYLPVWWGASVYLAYRVGVYRGFNKGTVLGRASAATVNEVLDRLHYKVKGESIELDPEDVRAAIAEVEGLAKAEEEANATE